MNNPLAGPQGNFKLISSRNKTGDENSLIDLRSESPIVPSNPCKFPSKIFVINLGDRTDRWWSFQRNNSDLFKNFEVNRWEATQIGYNAPKVEEAIFQSFLGCLESSLESEECVIIMEDDFGYYGEQEIIEKYFELKNLKRYDRMDSEVWNFIKFTL